MNIGPKKLNKLEKILIFKSKIEKIREMDADITPVEIKVSLLEHPV